VTVYKRPQPALFVQPLDGATFVGLQPEFQWVETFMDDFPTPDGYFFNLWRQGYSETIISLDVGNTLSYALTSTLTIGESYNWQVIPYVNTAIRGSLAPGYKGVGQLSNYPGRDDSYVYALNCPLWAFSTQQPLPPRMVSAAEISNEVLVSWVAPYSADETWLHYDDGSLGNSIGTAGTADFDVAIRYPASALTQYAGLYLKAIKVRVASAGSFSLRVWTGGTSTAPGTMQVDQPFTPELNTYQEILLNTPVLITGTEELWFGYRCNVTEGYPAGCDPGPAVDGFGNMMYWQESWSSLLTLAPTLDYNWSVQGLVGSYKRNDGYLTTLEPIVDNHKRNNTGILSASGISHPHLVNNSNPSREILLPEGYEVWRLLSGQESYEASWTLVAQPMTYYTALDNQWTDLSPGLYKWAVKAVYAGGIYSTPAFSNELVKEILYPVISVSPGSISYSLSAADSLQLQVVISNSGTAQLIWYSSITVIPSKHNRQLYVSLSPPNGIVQPDSSQVCFLNINPAEDPQGMNYFELEITSNDIENPLITVPITIEVTAPPAYIPDDNFRMAINEALEQEPEYQPTIADLNSFTGSLDFSNKNISSIEGAQYFVNVSLLFLDGNQISELSPLSSLSNLNVLDLSGNQISEISPLAGLGNLIELFLHDNPLSKESMLLTHSWGLPYGASVFNALAACYPNPARNQVDVNTDNNLQWQGNYNQETVSYEVWVGSSPTGLVHLGDGVALSDSLYSYPMVFNPHSEYYWRIKAVTAAETVWSGMWHFTTGEQAYNPPLNVSAVNDPNSAFISWNSPIYPSNPSSYQVWRLQPGEETEEASWTLVSGAVSDTTATDPQWAYLADGTYKWAVKAMYAGGVFSVPAFSNELQKMPVLFPAIAVTPEFINVSLNVMDSIQNEVTIANNGDGALIWTSQVLDNRSVSANRNKLFNPRSNRDQSRTPIISSDPNAGNVNPGSNQIVNLSINAGDTAPGFYEYSYTVSSNDPDAGEVVIPISLEVFESDKVPESLTANAGDGLIFLSWNTVNKPSLLQYVIYRDGAEYANTTDTYFEDNAVVNGTSYSYYVIAVYHYASSLASNTASATPQAAINTGLVRYFPLNGSGFDVSRSKSV
ncbi:MAG: hypothetical protein RBS43_11050, partial [Candidatus Cloacimonas sp.]|nr:hypothetical protein [Candidatus Cloacimonas sp.]